MTQRVTDRGGIIHMGARPYSAAHGRFLAVDPSEGGCANDYVYVFGDPTNLSDLDGKGLFGIQCGCCGDVWDATMRLTAEAEGWRRGERAS